MKNQKTNVAGYVVFAGTVMSAVGELFAHTSWGQALRMVGLALSGVGAGKGFLAAADAK